MLLLSTCTYYMPFSCVILHLIYNLLVKLLECAQWKYSFSLNSAIIHMCHIVVVVVFFLFFFQLSTGHVNCVC